MANVNSTNDNAPAVDAGQNEPAKDGNAAVDKANAGETFPTDWEGVFKHPRFKELTTSNQELKAQIAEYEKAKAEAAQAAEEKEAEELRAKEEFKTLAEKQTAKLDQSKEEAKALKAKIEAYEKIAAEEIAARLATIPEPVKKLLEPLLEGKDPIEQLSLLQAQAETIAELIGDTGKGGRLPKGVPATPKGDSQASLNEADKEAYAKNYRAALRQGL